MRFNRLKQYIKFRLKNYSIFSICLKDRSVIVPFDGKEGKYGLADRLRHCLSLYLYCQQNKLSYKIYHVFPFRLENILKPNKFNWVIDSGLVSKSIYRTRSIKIRSYYKSTGIDEDIESNMQLQYLNKKIISNKFQYHVYGNAHFFKSDWKNAFDDLFSPSDELCELLDSLKLPASYEAVSLRFQQLLGDFKEDGFPILSENEQNTLIEKCISEINSLRCRNFFSTKTILVTSDSVRFLNHVKILPDVIVIDGERAHPGTPLNNSERTYMNSFIDLYALRNAKRITLLRTGDMYNSGFPEFAARIGNKIFQIHSF